MVFDHIARMAYTARSHRARLKKSGREVIALSHAQLAEFVGNSIELSGHSGRILALSQRGSHRLKPTQTACIERSVRLLSLVVPTMEKAGARCAA